MSGISTGARFAILRTASGITLDAYSTWEQLASQALYVHALGSYQSDAFGGIADDAALCTAMLARLDAMYQESRMAIIRNVDPARLRAPEVWPWHDEGSGAAICADRYYGFVEGGGLVGDFAGYETAGVAKSFIGREQEVSAAQIADYFSTDPEALGGVPCCVLSGRQYVDRLYQLCGPGGSGWDLSDYGKWHELDGGGHAVGSDNRV